MCEATDWATAFAFVLLALTGCVLSIGGLYLLFKYARDL